MNSVRLIDRDDEYRTRQHALNIGLAWGIGLSTLSIAIILAFSIDLVWLLRTIPLSLAVGVGSFSKALIEFTNDAHNIIWESNLSVSQPQSVDNVSPPPAHAKRGSFPHPDHKNGMLMLSVKLTDQQREEIAQAGINHGKLTVNFLVGVGLSRENAERLREELVGHRLAHFDERQRAIITAKGKRSFRKLLNKS